MIKNGIIVILSITTICLGVKTYMLEDCYKDLDNIQFETEYKLERREQTIKDLYNYINDIEQYKLEEAINFYEQNKDKI